MAEMATQPRKAHPAPARDLPGAAALLEPSMAPHSRFPPILTLNVAYPLGWIGMS